MSRYDSVPIYTLPSAPGLRRYPVVDGSGAAALIVYRSRRFLPQPSSMPQSSTYIVETGQRLDQIATVTLGDPGLYWQICDANNTMAPDALVDTPGRRLRVPVPQVGSSGQIVLTDPRGQFE